MVFTQGRLIAIAVIGILLLILFGHTPSDEWKQKVQKKKAKQLVEKITEYNKKHEKGMFGGSGAAISGVPTGSATPLGIGGDTSSDQTQADIHLNPNLKNQYSTPAKKMQNSYLRGNNTSAQPQQFDNGPAPAQPGTAPANEDYYPPTAPATKGSGLKPQSVLQPLFHKHQGLNVGNGTFASFEGTRAFVKDENGNVKPLKDGKYKISDHYSITIRGGEKVLND